MNGISAYRQHAVTTQSKGQIVVLLYEGAVRFLYQAVEAIEAGDIALKAEKVDKAIEIILELNSVLDMEAGGEVAQNLRSLYNFMLTHTTVAHVRNDVEKLREVIRMLEELLAAWRSIAR